MENRTGILAAGNWIIDKIKIIDEFPHQDGLANILDEQTNNGGAAYNVLKDLAKLKAKFPLYGCGLVGNDDNGRHILEDCKIHGINIEYLQSTSATSTSFTDVMTVKSNGRRTFFHQRGANALLSPDHIPLTTCQAKILHLGYMLLLDTMDEILENGRTVASKVFENAIEMGFITSTDVVSEASDRFQSIVLPSLPFIDILFVNEYELSKVSGIEVFKNNSFHRKSALEAAQSLLDKGIRRWVIVHFPQGAMAVDKEGNVYDQSALNIPKDRIKGTAGAGDAFASGVLMGLHENWTMERCLLTGVCCAASSLFDASCSEGIVSIEQVMKIPESLSN